MSIAASFGSAGQCSQGAGAKAATTEPGGQKAGFSLPSNPFASPHDRSVTYEYILRSIQNPGRYYVGVTRDLRARLQKHNAGDVSHTSKYAPWAIKTYIAFTDEKQAIAFEKYLKSASGRAFAKKRL